MVNYATYGDAQNISFLLQYFRLYVVIGGTFIVRKLLYDMYYVIVRYCINVESIINGRWKIFGLG